MTKRFAVVPVIIGIVVKCNVCFLNLQKCIIR
jgi:hypothetical protein